MASSNGDEQPTKRIPIDYHYPEPFGLAECVYCFPVEQLFILTDSNVILAEWLRPGMQFHMEDAGIGTITAVDPIEVWEPPSRVPDEHGRYLRRVLGTIKHKGFVVIDITFGGQTVTCTPNHLWYSATRKTWVPAQTLCRGEPLLNGEGSVVAVESVSDPRYGMIELYNWEVEELHTFFVSASERHGSALVHNGQGNYIKKPANLPAANKLRIAWPHIAERHMPGGIYSRGRTIFQNMTEAQAQRAIRQAYGNSKLIQSQTSLSTGERRVLLRGTAGGLSIEMWVNVTLKIIETAYPIF